jgi:sensor c-di-GMP phosphodiesterase-like protein
MSYILFSFLFLAVLVSELIFVALLFVFKNGDSRVPLPLVRLLRVITNASVTWGYQPMITIIFMIIDCDFSSGKGMCDMFPEVPCWEGA